MLVPSCVPLSTPTERPSLLAEASIGDIEVVAAIGDSVSTGFNARNERPLDMLTSMMHFDNVGAAFSVGADADVLTLPQLLRRHARHDSDVKGVSRGTRAAFSMGATTTDSFNVAMPGATLSALPQQAAALARLLRERLSADELAGAWKHVTLFGGNKNLCLACTHRADDSAAAFRAAVDAALRLLRDSVPRLLVSLVALPDLTQYHRLAVDRPWCRLVAHVTCQCGSQLSSDDDRRAVRDATRAFNAVLRDLEREWRGREARRGPSGTSSFGVVLQPFMEGVSFLGPRGSNDTSFVSPSDCFHPNVRGHELLARGLWNNLLQPRGRKAATITQDVDALCPSALAAPRLRLYTSPPTLHVAAPGVGTVWTRGLSHRVRWRVFGYDGAVRVELLEAAPEQEGGGGSGGSGGGGVGGSGGGGGGLSVVRDVLSNATVAWSLAWRPRRDMPVGRYRIGLRALAPAARGEGEREGEGEGAAPPPLALSEVFELRAPRLWVASPSECTFVALGSALRVEWRTRGLPPRSRVRIALEAVCAAAAAEACPPPLPIATDAPNSGVYEWTTPGHLPAMTALLNSRRALIVRVTSRLDDGASNASSPFVLVETLPSEAHTESSTDGTPHARRCRITIEAPQGSLGSLAMLDPRQLRDVATILAAEVAVFLACCLPAVALCLLRRHSEQRALQAPHSRVPT